MAKGKMGKLLEKELYAISKQAEEDIKVNDCYINAEKYNFISKLVSGKIRDITK